MSTGTHVTKHVDVINSDPYFQQAYDKQPICIKK